MQFHHHGYRSADPRVQQASGVGVDRPHDLPEFVDVLVVGTGPAGVITAAQLSQFPEISTRIVEQRPGRLEIGQADGLACRSIETFAAFGFAERIIEEAYRITETAFWGPDPRDRATLVRTGRTPDDPTGISEFPHLVCNQARVIDEFVGVMERSPSRMTPDYGYALESLERTDDPGHPLVVVLRRTEPGREDETTTVRAKYVVGADGARSSVRRAIGRRLVGDSANHAWGVMDVLLDTDFPDIRTKCAITSGGGGNILLIPREGGYLVRLYVDLGVVAPDDAGEIRRTTPEQSIEIARRILQPYRLEVRDLAWYSVYEVGQRLTDRFDDVPDGMDGAVEPRVFIMGDACHTHSAKAGQGMNVSMQDGFNLGWKLGAVLRGLAPASLLDTYSAERQPVAQQLIDFDKQWSSLMAAKPMDPAHPELGGADPEVFQRFYVDSFGFTSGFGTQYAAAPLTLTASTQEAATGFPVGRRFWSTPAMRVCDANPLEVGHLHRADGRFRLYVYADRPRPGEPSKLEEWARWAAGPDSPLRRFTPAGADDDAVFDVKVIYQQDYSEVDLNAVPSTFRPTKGPFALTDLNQVFAADAARDIDAFRERGVSRDGAVVLVRPDMYVSAVLPLTATAALDEHLSGIFLPQR